MSIMAEKITTKISNARKKLRPFKLAIIAYFSNTKNRLKRLISRPQLPQNPDGRVLIHLGCGEQNAPGWINVDAQPFPHVNFVGGVEKLPMFASNSANLIYACHVLEHISYQRYPEILKEWRRVLKPGGVLRIAVPDFDKLIVIYQTEKNNINLVLPPMMGAQDCEHGFHRGAFNEKYLSDLCLDAGFKKTRLWNPKTAPDYPFDDWAKKLAHGKYPISLNLEAIK